MDIKLRTWQVSDASFIIELRNRPSMSKWFRQDHLISLEEQQTFISNDGGRFNGQIVELDGKRIGVLAVKGSGELSLVLPQAYHYLLTQILPNTDMWGEVFVKNPLLKTLIMNDFNIIGVHEGAYYKKGIGYVDVVKIERRPKMDGSYVSQKTTRSTEV